MRFSFIQIPLFGFALLFFCFNFQAETLLAQSTFLKTYGSSFSEYGTSLCVSPDGGFVVSGILPDAAGDIRVVLFKTDINGNQQWVKSYGVAAKNVPGKVINSSDGGYYLLFSSWTIFSPANFYTVLVKTDSLGNEVWNRTISETQSDKAIDIEFDGQNIYVIATGTYNTGGYPTVLVHKLDTSGALQWSYRYNANYQFSPVSSAFDRKGRLGIVGTTNSYGIGTPINDNNFLLLLDTLGNIINTTITGVFYSDEPHSLVWQNGTWVFSSLTYTLASEYDISIQRFDSLGNFIQSNVYDATPTLYQWEVARDIIPQTDGSLILTGDLGTFDERNVMLAKINVNRNVDWAVQYPVSPMFTNYGFQVVKTKDNGYAFTGDMRPLTSFRNAYIIKTDSIGQIPCFTAPVNFTMNADTPEVSYVTVFKTEVFPTISSVTLNENTPFYPEVIECERVPPAALFTESLDTLCPQACYLFEDKSFNPVDTWTWTFNGGVPASYSGPRPPIVCYQQPGNYEVKLEVSNPDGVSFFSSNVHISKVKCDTLFIPNVITPNGDGKNDIFNITGLPDRFNLQIYNRWGKMLFETQNENLLWNPKDVSAGVYYYLLRLYSSEGNEDHRGVVIVLSGMN